MEKNMFQTTNQIGTIINETMVAWCFEDTRARNPLGLEFWRMGGGQKDAEQCLQDANFSRFPTFCRRPQRIANLV